MGVVLAPDLDLFSDEVLLDPYPAYQVLRDLGVVETRRYGVWIVSRDAHVREVLKDWHTYSSAWGTAIDPGVNGLRATNIISTDPPAHDELRDVLAPQMSARSVRELQGRIDQVAADLVDGLLETGGGDVVARLAQPLPLRIVGDLVGFAEEGREGLLEWVDASFNTFGPMNQRTRESIPKLESIWEYLDTMATRERLAPGGLGAAIHDAKDQGRISADQCRSLLFAYATAGIDTTVNAISSAVWLLARFPEQWSMLRSDPSLVSGAANEVLRVESPIQSFTRLARVTGRLGDTIVPRGSRVLVLFGSANRDERKWQDPARFDVGRAAADHVAFGYGVHSCAGQFLAKAELQGVLRALVERVSTIRLVSAERKLHNVLRGFRHLDVVLG